MSVIEDLKQVYHPNYMFSLHNVPVENLQKKVKIYWRQVGKNMVDVNTVMKLAYQREPTNMSMTRPYNQDRMEKLFNYRTGYYGEYFETFGSLAPNIAIFTPAHLKDGTIVNILSVVGLAFDSVEQPDYKYVMKLDSVEREEFITKFLFGVFGFIFKCAYDNNFEIVVLSKFGAGNFASKYQDDKGSGSKRMTEIWDAAFRRYIRENFVSLEIKIMGDELAGYDNIGFFPANVSKIDQDTTLFVNAWDPWSMLGNGNKGDNSLDGHIGRNTDLLLVGWPGNNPYLNDKNKYIKMT